MIPGLSELAEAMHRHGARCAVQIQHPGPPGGLAPQGPHVGQRPGGRSARLGRPRGGLRRGGRQGEVDPGDDRRGDLRAGREVRRRGLARAAGGLRLRRAARRPRLPDRPVHEPLRQQAQRPLRRQLHQPHAVRPGDRQPDQAQVRQGFSHRRALLGRGVGRGSDGPWTRASRSPSSWSSTARPSWISARACSRPRPP